MKSFCKMLILTSGLFAALFMVVAQAQDEAPKPKPTHPIANQQSEVYNKFIRFEMRMELLAEKISAKNPEQAVVLRQALEQCKKDLLALKMEKVQGKLKNELFGSGTVNDEKAIEEGLGAVLEILLSPNKADRIAEERKRIQKILDEVKQIQKKEKALRAANTPNSDPQKNAEKQGDIADDTQKLLDHINKEYNENGEPRDGKPKDGEPKDGKPQDGKPKDGEPKDGKPKDGKPQDGEPKDGKPQDGEPKDGEPKDGKPQDGEPKDGEPKDGEPKDGKPKDGEPKDGKPKDGEPKDGEPKDGKPKDGKPQDGKPQDGEPKDGKPQDGEPKDGKPQDGKPQDGQPQDGQPQDGQPQDGQPQDGQQPPQQQQEKQPPARKRLEQAKKHMEDAKKKLEDAQKREATKDIDKALDELAKAEAELEEILRQLREEELKQVLVQLEARFRKMLDLQRSVYESTLLRDKTPVDQRGPNHEFATKALALREREILTECDRALTLLRDDGTSVAFPEAVEQMREDIVLVERFLNEANVGKITQGVEEDIILALTELIEAVKKAQQDMEDKKQQQQQQQQQGDPPDPALIDQLAELKMIKTLQERVNKRTKRFAEQLGGEGQQATDSTLLKLLDELAERERRIFEITRDIITGRNR